MKKLPLIISAVIILSLTAYIFQLKAQINNQSSVEPDQNLHGQCSAEAERLKTEIDTWMTTAKQNADEASRNALIAQHSKKEADEQRSLAIENEMKARAMMKAAEEQMKLAEKNEKMAQQTIAQLQEKLKNRN